MNIISKSRTAVWRWEGRGGKSRPDCCEKLSACLARRHAGELGWWADLAAADTFRAAARFVATVVASAGKAVVCFGYPCEAEVTSEFTKYLSEVSGCLARCDRAGRFSNCCAFQRLQVWGPSFYVIQKGDTTASSRLAAADEKGITR